MWVSRKEFDELKNAHSHIEINRCAIEQLYENMATLTKQIKCKCENFEVQDRYEIICEHNGRSWWARGDMIGTLDGSNHEKVCLDCGWTTTYDTEEEALADKQELLDKQIDALKEQKKSLKK